MSTAPRKRLGDYLLERGWITSEQLQRALQNHRTLGGRLGTCLLELDALPEDLLIKSLGELNQVPTVSVDELRQAQEAAYKLLTPRVAKRCQAIPFRLEGNQILVGMLDVHNLQLQDELGFVTGKRVKIFLANEARVYEGMDRFYGEECPQRYTNLLDRLNRTRYLWERTVAMTPPDGAAEMGRASQWSATQPIKPPPLPPREATSAGPTEPPPIPPPAASAAAPGAAAPPPAQTPAPAAPEPPAEAAAVLVAPPKPRSFSVPIAPEELVKLRSVGEELTFEQVQTRLLDPVDRDAVGQALLGYLVGQFRRVALLRVVREEIAGWMGAGELEPELLRGFSGRFSEPSIFVGLRQNVPFVRGPLAPFPLHRRLAESWGGELPGDCLLLPIRIKDRLVTIIYADRGKDGLQALDLEPLQRLTAKAGIAFELCIMRGKLKQA